MKALCIFLDTSKLNQIILGYQKGLLNNLVFNFILLELWIKKRLNLKLKFFTCFKWGISRLHSTSHVSVFEHHYLLNGEILLHIIFLPIIQWPLCHCIPNKEKQRKQSKRVFFLSLQSKRIGPCVSQFSSSRIASF